MSYQQHNIHHSHHNSCLSASTTDANNAPSSSSTKNNSSSQQSKTAHHTTQQQSTNRNNIKRGGKSSSSNSRQSNNRNSSREPVSYAIDSGNNYKYVADYHNSAITPNKMIQSPFADGKQKIHLAGNNKLVVLSPGGPNNSNNSQTHFIRVFRKKIYKVERT